MELAIILVFVFIIWTNEALFGKSLVKEKPKKTADEKFAEAIKDYLKEGFKVRVDCPKDNK
ncbi:hypothetical protein [Nodosilinea sp. P-1105]|uniref:hypothetical protein n=1 Tax=Nodosilinea sp. P-1105 TaxID=2546229 RepID=UPI00146D7026|nr:hypothetical protein [Nodosilinea sp. P-1105]NMF84998.1 hypothetical protein [Nodosilinea sp. P-1105]